MYILCNWSFLLLLTCPCCLANVCGRGCLTVWCPEVTEPEFNSHIDPSVADPDDPYPCAKLWCPSVRQVTFNRYICHLLQDPDLLPTTTTTTTTTTEEPTTAHWVLVPGLLDKGRQKEETRRNSMFGDTKQRAAALW
uniref:Basic tail secreted protein n=1 Tax=Rhipicephalus appendiculatus TaxID=34631 RepID=A0A131Z395_RHIAP